MAAKTATCKTMATQIANWLRLRAAFSNFLFWFMTLKFLDFLKTNTKTAYFDGRTINEIFNAPRPFLTRFLTSSYPLPPIALSMRQLLFTHLLFVFTCPNYGQDSLQLRQQIDKLVRFEAEIDVEKTPGFIIGIIDGDYTFILPYGTLLKDSLLPPDEHTFFEIGDLTQVFTASILCQLANEGKLDFNKSVNTYLPDSLKNQSAENVTVMDFLTHRTGLPRLPFGIGQHARDDGQLFSNYPLPYLSDYFLDFDFSSKKDRKYSYSPTAYAMLDFIFYQILSRGKMLDEYIKLKIFEPNDMPESYWGVGPAPTVGYDKAGHPAEPRVFKSFLPALGMKSTLHDLLNFLKANLNDNIFTQAHQPQIPTGIHKNTWAAMGWHVICHRKRPNIITHTGTSAGHRSAIAFVKETKTGVVILSNSPFGLNGLEFSILRMLNDDWKREKRRD